MKKEITEERAYSFLRQHLMTYEVVDELFLKLSSQSFFRRQIIPH